MYKDSSYSFHNGKKGKNPETSVRELSNKLWYIYTVEYHTAIKMIN